MFALFRRRPVVDGRVRIDAQLESLEGEAQLATEANRAHLFNRAGDLCAHSGRKREALAYYGRAVDAYLQAGCLTAAAAMCRKILRAEPQAVRVHSTLACIALQDRDGRSAREEIDLYVQASRRTRTENLAISRLRLLCAAAEDAEFKLRIAEHLHEMGDSAGALRVRESIGRAEHVGTLIRDEGQWERLLRVAVLDPDDLWHQQRS